MSNPASVTPDSTFHGTSTAWPSTRQPLGECVVTVGREWLAEIRSACVIAARNSRLEDATPLGVLVEDVTRDHLGEFDAAHRNAVVRLNGPLAECTAGLLAELRTALLALGPILSKGALGIIAARRNSGVDPMAAVEGLLDRLSVLVPPVQAPLRLRPEKQERIWNALQDKAMTAKDIASEVFGGGTTDDAVRQLIDAMREAGDAVETRRGRGYFRPDAPPSRTV